jgi:hypothetical protein
MAETVTFQATESNETITVTINEQSRGPTGADGAAGLNREVKSASFTAENGKSYSVVATATITDPSPVEGKGYNVLVRNGTATIGGVAHSTAGTLIERVFHSGSWATYSYAQTNSPTLTAPSMSAPVVTGTARMTMASVTGTPAATDAITRGDGDARYARSWAAALAAGVNSDTNTTTYKTVTELSFDLEVGTYFIECILIHNGNASYATAGVKDRLNFTGTATAAGTLYRAYDNATTSSTVPNALASRSPIAESAIGNRSQKTWRNGILTVTAAGTIQVQIAQNTAVSSAFTTLDAGSSISITKV